MSELMTLAARAIDGARGGEAVEAYATHGVTTSVRAYEGEIENLSSAETRGVGIRLVVDGRMGFAATSDVSDDGLRLAFAEARSNAALGTADPGNVLPQPADYEPLPGILVDGLAEVPPARKVEIALELERLTLAADERVRGVSSASYGDALSYAAVVSTTGVAAEYGRSDVYAYVSALARDGEETQTGFGLTTARSVGELDLPAAAVEGARRAARLLGARKAKTATVPVVFDPLVTAEFLGVLAGAFSAEAVQKGRSLFASSVGEAVAEAALSIVDDGRLLAGPAAAPVDDEGVPTRRTTLVRDGVLQGFLHNTETAARAGGAARSTGNAARAGSRSSPGVGSTNMFFEGETTEVAALLARAEGGLYVQDVSGLHSGVNPVSGEFSVGATGLWIRGGELTEPVREVTVSSTIVAMLLAVAALGDDRRFFPVGGSMAGATLLLQAMTVAGA